MNKIILFIPLFLSACILQGPIDSTKNGERGILTPLQESNSTAKVIPLSEEEFSLEAIDNKREEGLFAEGVPLGLQASESTAQQYIASPEELQKGRKTEKNQEIFLELGLQPTVYFAFDQSVLSDESKEVLMAYIAAFTTKSLGEGRFRLILEGHADQVGTSQYNLSLGFRRALAVRSFLTEQGIPETILEVESFGEERPVFDEPENDYQRYNRRVEIYFSN